MTKILKWYWWALLGISGFLGLSGLAPIMFRAWFQNAGFLDHPETLFAQLVTWATDSSVMPWLAIVSLMLVAVPLAAGGWNLADAWWDVRKIKLETLGRDMTRQAGAIRLAQGGFRNPWPDNFSAGRGKLEAVLVTANRFWMASPGEAVFATEDGRSLLLDYLETVGAHLRAGNFRVARRRARELSKKRLTRLDPNQHSSL